MISTYQQATAAALFALGIICSATAPQQNNHEPAAPATDTGSASASSPSGVGVDEEIAALRRRLDELEAEVKQQHAASSADSNAAALRSAARELTPASSSSTSPAILRALAPSPAAAVAPTQSAAPVPPDPHAPAFSDWDWTWLNGNPRNNDTAWDSKVFTPEVRADLSYTHDFNKPVDNSIGGSSEIFRSNEIQLEQLGVGGTFHLDNAHARLLTQFGDYSTTTPRNDPSYAKGQWDLAGAYGTSSRPTQAITCQT